MNDELLLKSDSIYFQKGNWISIMPLSTCLTLFVTCIFNCIGLLSQLFAKQQPRNI